MLNRVVDRHMCLTDHSKLVLDLWTKFESPESRSYSDKELEFSRQLINSSVPYEKFIGELVLFESGSPTNEKFAEMVEAECAKGVGRLGLFEPNILCFQFAFDVDVLMRRAIREFIYASATTGSTACRINSAHLLFKMARKDPEAKSLLEYMTRDADVLVSSNAKVFWRKFGTG